MEKECREVEFEIRKGLPTDVDFKEFLQTGTNSAIKNLLEYYSERIMVNNVLIEDVTVIVQMKVRKCPVTSTQ